MEDIINKINTMESVLHQKKLTSIEKDLILCKLRQVYEIVLLKNAENIVPVALSAQHETKEQKPVAETITPKSASAENETDNGKDVEFDDPEKTQTVQDPISPLTDIDLLTHTMPIQKHESKEPELTLFDVKENEQNTALNQAEQVPVQKHEAPEIKNETISDQFRKSSGKTLSDVISKPQSTANFNIKPVKNIRSAININDRIMFTKELFGNDSESFHKVLENLNSKNNFEEATAYFLQEMKEDKDAENIEKFMDIIRRRFPE